MTDPEIALRTQITTGPGIARRGRCGLEGKNQGPPHRKMAGWIAAVVLATSFFATLPAWAQWPAGGAPVCTAAGEQTGPSIVTDGQGGAILVWNDGRDSWRNVFAQRISVTGEIASGWPLNGIPVSTSPYARLDPVLVDDNSGGATIFWIEKRPNVDAVYAQHVDASGQLAEGWPSEGFPIVNFGVNCCLRAVRDGAGGALLTLVHYHYECTERCQPSPLEGRAIRISPSGEQLWAVSLGSYVEASTDGLGGFILASRTAQGALLALRLDASGAVAPGWPSGGVILRPQLHADAGTAIVPDGAGGALIAWTDLAGIDVGAVLGGLDYGAIDIFAQHVMADGSTGEGWPTDGLSVCGAPGDQVFLAMVSDNVGGFYVAWQDTRDLGYAVYAQHYRRRRVDLPRMDGQRHPGQQASFIWGQPDRHRSRRPWGSVLDLVRELRRRGRRVRAAPDS